MRSSRVHIIITLFVLMGTAASAQTVVGRNLISNPSFEKHRRCPDKINPVGVLKIVNAWFQPTSGSADYYNVCGGIECFVPNNKLGFQHPRTGEGYCGIYCSKDNYREYLQTQLERPLKHGRTYRLSFFVSLSEYSTGGVATIGQTYRSQAPAGQERMRKAYLRLTAERHPSGELRFPSCALLAGATRGPA